MATLITPAVDLSVAADPLPVVARIVKRFEFEAGHQLYNHDGKCARPHGHSYKVEVCAAGPINTTPGAPDEGMVIDFGAIKDAFVRRVFDVCDHQDLNAVLPVSPTTAENIAVWIIEEMRAELAGTRVEWVRVYETRTSYAEAR